MKKLGELGSIFFNGISSSVRRLDSSLWWCDLRRVGDECSEGWFEANVRKGLGDARNEKFWHHHWIG